MALDLSNPIITTPPPVKGTRQTAGSSKAAEKARDAKMSEREDGVNGLFQLAAIPLLATGQIADMGACAEHGPRISHEAAVLAESNTKVAELLDRLIAVGPFAGLLATTVPFVLQILVNHGRLPANGLQAFGVFPPQMMQQKAALKIQIEQANLARAQAEAEAELREAQESFARANGSPPKPEA